MEIVKQTEEYQIIKKRNGRYGVRAGMPLLADCLDRLG